VRWMRGCDGIGVGHFNLVVDIAGVIWIGIFEDLAEQVHRNVFDVIWLAAVHMTHTLPDDLRAAEARIWKLHPLPGSRM